MRCHNLTWLLMAAASLGASGCMGTEAELAHAEDEVTVEPSRIALTKGANAGADEIDGYCENGLGVYLSAANDTAELTLYAVTPAVTATFERPTLHLKVDQGDSQITQDREFETVTLKAGESRVFSLQAEGTLMEAAAELSAH